MMVLVVMGGPVTPVALVVMGGPVRPVPLVVGRPAVACARPVALVVDCAVALVVDRACAVAVAVLLVMLGHGRGDHHQGQHSNDLKENVC